MDGKQLFEITAMALCGLLYLGFMYVSYKVEREAGKSILASILLSPLIGPRIIWETLFDPEP